MLPLPLLLLPLLPTPFLSSLWFIVFRVIQTTAHAQRAHEHDDPAERKELPCAFIIIIIIVVVVANRVLPLQISQQAGFPPVNEARTKPRVRPARSPLSPPCRPGRRRRTGLGNDALPAPSDRDAPRQRAPRTLTRTERNHTLKYNYNNNDYNLY